MDKEWLPTAYTTGGIGDDGGIFVGGRPLLFPGSWSGFCGVGEACGVGEVGFDEGLIGGIGGNPAFESGGVPYWLLSTELLKLYVLLSKAKIRYPIKEKINNPKTANKVLLLNFLARLIARISDTTKTTMVPRIGIKPSK